MSKNTPDAAFWTRANALINIANIQCDSTHPNEVSASMLYAAARFNAFIVANNTGNAQDMKLQKDRALDYLTDQFRQMMESNLDDFIGNFESYMVKPE